MDQDDKQLLRERLAKSLTTASLDYDPVDEALAAHQRFIARDMMHITPTVAAIGPRCGEKINWNEARPVWNWGKGQPDMSHVTGKIPWWRLLFTNRVRFELYHPEGDQPTRFAAWTSSYNAQWYVWIKLNCRTTLIITGDVFGLGGSYGL